MARRKVSAQQVARWKGERRREQERKKRDERLHRNHSDDCAVFQRQPCSCGGRTGSGGEL